MTMSACLQLKKQVGCNSTSLLSTNVAFMSLLTHVIHFSSRPFKLSWIVSHLQFCRNILLLSSLIRSSKRQVIYIKLWNTLFKYPYNYRYIWPQYLPSSSSHHILFLQPVLALLVQSSVIHWIVVAFGQELNVSIFPVDELSAWFKTTMCTESFFQ